MINAAGPWAEALNKSVGLDIPYITWRLRWLDPDQHPLMGQAGPEGFYLQCGMSGAGFNISPAAGLCMSELILDGESKTVDISIYHPGRFEEGREIQGNYESIWR